MIYWSSHTHTNISDGDLSVAELIEKAAKEGLTGITVTDHFPFPFSMQKSDWDERLKAFQRHLENVDRLREKAGKMEVLKGIEAEFVEPPYPLESYLSQMELDFVLGGVHVIDGWVTDWTEEIFREGERYFGSFKVAAQKYFRAVGDMAEGGLVDSLAHPDLIKKYNANSIYFSEEETWYHEAVEECLERIARTGVAIEVNTAGLRRPVRALHPSGWILSRARELGIPATIGTDFHLRDGLVGEGLDAAFAALRAAGYDSYLLFRKRKPEKISL